MGSGWIKKQLCKQNVRVTENMYKKLHKNAKTQAWWNENEID